MTDEILCDLVISGEGPVIRVGPVDVEMPHQWWMGLAEALKPQIESEDEEKAEIAGDTFEKLQAAIQKLS